MNIDKAKSITITKVTDLNSPEYHVAMKLYNDLFPEEERLSPQQIEEMITGGVYTLCVARHIELDKIIGFALVVFSEDPAFLFIDNIAIDSSLQGKGYGSMLFTGLEKMQEEKSQGIFLEIELPAQALDEEDRIAREKRVGFYERLGCQAMQNIPYLFPIKDQEPLPLLLMFKPAPGVNKLPAEIVKQMVKCVYNEVHYDVPNREEIFNSFAHTIQDQFFEKAHTQEDKYII
ncbi:MAG: GNAT family N-acetyltransferase [Syntrophomonadaceae bacterium]|nr:GNAT family N-acetyltransferase [Syntrophomonadaceae bacterium]